MGSNQKKKKRSKKTLQISSNLSFESNKKPTKLVHCPLLDLHWTKQTIDCLLVGSNRTKNSRIPNIFYNLYQPNKKTIKFIYYLLLGSNRAKQYTTPNIFYKLNKKTDRIHTLFGFESNQTNYNAKYFLFYVRIEQKKR